MHKLYVHDRSIAGYWDAVYARYLHDIKVYGDTFVGRNGETKALFGCSITVDTRVGFPLTRLRKMPIQNLIREFLFVIGFDQNVEALGPARHFWDFLADDEGNLGASAYNRQWRMWPQSASGSEVANEKLAIDRPVDQLQSVIQELRVVRNSRRATVITHNPTAINPACPPCHLGLQFAASSDGYLDVMVPARSNDMVVGFPLDIARYAIILHVIAKAVDMTPRYVYMPSANSHIYQNCYGIVDELLSRQAGPECQLVISSDWDCWSEFPLEALKPEHIGVTSYEPQPAIKIAVN